jgi:hypothetical protein
MGKGERVYSMVTGMVGKVIEVITINERGYELFPDKVTQTQVYRIQDDNGNTHVARFNELRER